MSETLWAGEEERTLSCDGIVCCLCRRSDERARLLSLDSVLFHDRVYSYRRILYECFRIKTATVPKHFFVCHDCRLVLRRTRDFFLRIKAAQLELRPTHVSDDKPAERSNDVVTKKAMPKNVVTKKDTAIKRRRRPKIFQNLGDFDVQFAISNPIDHDYLGPFRKIDGKESGGGEWACDACGKLFPTRHSVKSHYQTVHSRRLFACALCPPGTTKTFKTPSYLLNHRRAVHGVDGDPRRSACPKCPERFKSYVARLRHLTQAHGVEPPDYSCEPCARRFRSRQGLNSHLKRLHLNVTKHACDACGERFFDRWALQRHTLKHTGAMDFECLACGKRFARKSTLVQHAKTHSI